MRDTAEHFGCVSILRSPWNLTAHLQVVAWLPTSLVFVEQSLQMTHIYVNLKFIFSWRDVNKSSIWKSNESLKIESSYTSLNEHLERSFLIHPEPLLTTAYIPFYFSSLEYARKDGGVPCRPAESTHMKHSLPGCASSIVSKNGGRAGSKSKRKLRWV